LVVYTFRRADRVMARHRPEKKREPRAAADTKILPTQLHVGDRLIDETGEYEVVGRPYTTAAGRNAHVRVRRVDNAEVAMIRSYSAHERISVKQTSTEEGSRGRLLE
jgi:hypothetical protein